jgi:hypothetical protein
VEFSLGGKCVGRRSFVDAGWKWNMENGKSKEGGGENE